MRTARDDGYSAPISEMDNEGEEAEAEEEDVPEDEQEPSRISNINSMDPVQWSNVKRDIAAESRMQEAIKQRLLYREDRSKSPNGFPHGIEQAT